LWEKRGGWWKVTIISCGVEISTAEPVEEMVRDPMPWSFFSFASFPLYHIFIIKVQELACRASYSLKKTLIPTDGLLYIFIGNIKHPESIGQIPPA